LEYRLPLTWDIGVNILGLYLEALSIAAFWDGYTLVPENSALLQFNSINWTSGALFRQRILMFGRTITHLNGMVFYDPLKSSQHWDYRFIFSGQANF
jgi:hypothetical protein